MSANPKGSPPAVAPNVSDAGDTASAGGGGGPGGTPITYADSGPSLQRVSVDTMCAITERRSPSERSFGGLPWTVAGMIVFSVGLAPVYTLSTNLVVSSVQSSRAGMAAAVTETGAELGGALGIAVLGSIGVAAYRHGGAPVDGTLVGSLLLIVGGQDRTISPDVSFGLADRLGGRARVELLRGLGHLAHEEKPEVVAELIRAGMAQPGASAQAEPATDFPACHPPGSR